MENTSKAYKIPKRDIFYYRQRMKNRVFAELASFFADEAATHRITKREIAARLQCDPALITRWLSAPGNLTLETISDLLLSLNAEMDTRIVRFHERAVPNYVHPIISYVAEPQQKPAGGRRTKSHEHQTQPALVKESPTVSQTTVVQAILEPA